MLRTLPGYAADIAKNREHARQIMQRLGYGPDKRLAISVTTRNVAAYRDPAVILIDQLKEIYIDGTLNAVDTTQWYPTDTTQWYPTVMRKEYTLPFTVTETGLDEPDQMFYENYFCGSERNYTGYCNPEVDKLTRARSSGRSRSERCSRTAGKTEENLKARGQFGGLTNQDVIRAVSDSSLPLR